jgi:hypothetical protein
VAQPKRRAPTGVALEDVKKLCDKLDHLPRLLRGFWHPRDEEPTH